MQLKILQNEKVKKIQRFFPVISFCGGFAWDSVTLGRLVESSDLVFLLAYYLISFVVLILLSKKNLSEKWHQRFTYAIQFCFGSLFSALVVCYFKSGSSAGALFFVLLLAVLLVSNEFFQKRYAIFGFTLALFSLIGTMFINFAIPHLLDTIGFFIFLVSTLISFSVCVLANFLTHHSKKSLIAPAAISVLLLLAFIGNWIPPVPLVIKSEMACTHFEKDYSCQIADEGFWTLFDYETVYLSPEDDGIYFLSSVFAPAKITAQLEHRWYYENPQTKYFELVNKISSDRMKTHGSRDEGFRIYTKKENVPFGIWKVETAVKDGGVIGSHKFYVKPRDSKSPHNIRWQME